MGLDLVGVWLVDDSSYGVDLMSTLVFQIQNHANYILLLPMTLAKHKPIRFITCAMEI